MDATQFRQAAERNETLADYLDEVAQGAEPDEARRSTVATALFGVAAYAVYRWAKNYFDHHRGLEEADLRQMMLAQVEELVRQGWGRDKALEAVLKISKDVASLRPENPIVKAALSLLNRDATSPQ